MISEAWKTLLVITLVGLIWCVYFAGTAIWNQHQELVELKCRITMFEDGSSQFRDGEEAMACMHR